MLARATERHEIHAHGIGDVVADLAAIGEKR